MDNSVLGMTKAGKVDLQIIDFPWCFAGGANRPANQILVSMMFDRIIVERWVLWYGVILYLRGPQTNGWNLPIFSILGSSPTMSGWIE